MNIFNKVTIKSMKKNPVRTLVTIIGIIISTAMFTAVTTLVISLYSFIYRTQVYDSGSWHIGFEYKSNDYAAWEKNEKVEAMTTARVMGYAECGSSNEDKPYIYLLSVEDDFYELMPVHITYGRKPENSGEIMLPNHLSYNGNKNYNLGDIVTLNLGKRYVVDDDEKEYELSQGNPFTQDEELVADAEKQYTVVGFYERPEFEDYTAPGYTAITCGEPMDDANARYSFYIRLKKKYLSEVWSIGKDAGYNIGVSVSGKVVNYGSVKYNNNIISMEGSILYENVALVFTMLAAIFIAIIIVASVSMIYSAFSISVGERTKQFGLLSSVGATKRQLRHMVFGEAAMVSIIGIPIGVICGIVGIGITLHFVGGKFNYILTSPYSVDLVVNGYAILAAVLTALITVIISAIIPAARATSVSAIDAIRQHKDVRKPRLRWHAGRKYRLTKKLFGMPGMLARRYFSRSRKKYRVTIFSLSMSIVLFIVTSSYCSYLKGYVKENIDADEFDLRYDGFQYDKAQLDKILDVIKSADGVLDVSYRAWDYNYYLLCDESNVDESYLEYLRNVEEHNRYDSEDDGEKAVSDVEKYANVVFVDEEHYRECLNALGITGEKFNDYTNAPAIFQNAVSAIDILYDSTTDKYNRYNVEYRFLKDDVDSLTVSHTYGDEEIKEEIPIGAIVDKIPYNFDSLNNNVLFFPYSSKYRNDSVSKFFFIKQEKDAHDEMLKSVKEKLVEAGFDANDYLFYDPYDDINQKKNLSVLINVFSYGFITLMALICVGNVFNTISTNVSLRRRDFAMLRSIGLSYGGIKKMMVFECLLYGIRSTIFAAPLSVILSYLIYMAYGFTSDLGSGFYIPWYSVVIAVAGAFMVVAISMAYSVSKIKEDNLIDELKEEND